MNWRSEKPLEKNVASTAGEIIYKQGVLAKQLLKDFGKGFLITGTTATIADSAVINTELIDMQSGKRGIVPAPDRRRHRPLIGRKVATGKDGR